MGAAAAGFELRSVPVSSVEHAHTLVSVNVTGECSFESLLKNLRFGSLDVWRPDERAPIPAKAVLSGVV